MKQTVYVAEPEAIDTTLIRDELEVAGYDIFMGKPDFSGTIPESSQALLVRSQTKVTSGIKDAFPDLTSIIRVGTGLDNIDVEYCKANGISIYSAPGANAGAVSEYVVMMMLVALRKLHTLTAADISAWNRYKFRGRSLVDQSIGIIGYGAIGRLVYSHLRGLGCSSFYIHDPYINEAALPEGVKLSPLDDVIENADVVTLHLPLTRETEYLIGGEEIGRMQPGAVLINASRGGIVDEQAAAGAAKSDKIIYVADTVRGEPAINEALLGSDNIIITPHIASLTDSAETAMLRVAVDNFLKQNPTVSPQ